MNISRSFHRAVFERIEFSRSPNNLVRCTATEFFELRETVETRLASAFSKRDIVKVAHPHTVGETESAAFDKLVKQLRIRAAVDKDIMRFGAKPPQARLLTDTRTQLFEVVREKHPLHNHADPALLDLFYVSIDIGRVSGTTFDKDHIHIRRVSRQDIAAAALTFRR